MYSIPEIYETGSLPGVIPNHHYSPDGLGIVDKNKIRILVTESHYKKLPDVCLVLFEFKNPYSRIPDGLIPIDYRIQVQTGLNDIPETDIGIFLDMVVRPCSLKDLDWSNEYNAEQFNDRFEFSDPLAIGFIGFAKPISDESDESESDSESSKSISNTDFENMNFIKPRSGMSHQQPSKNELDSLEYFEDEIIDFGDTTEKNFYIISQQVVSKVIKPYYTEPIPKKFRFYHEFEKFEKYCKDNKLSIIGIMPYKIFDVRIATVKKEHDFIKEHHIESIVKAIKFIKKYKDRSHEDKIKALDKYYPKSQGSTKANLPYIYQMLN